MKRGDVTDWLLWALFATRPADALEEWKEELQEYTEVVEDMLEEKLEDGRADDVRSMRLTFDPVEVVHKPFLWYLVS